MRRTIELDGVVWTQLCRSIDVTPRHGFRVEVDIEHDIALFRLDDVVYGLDNVCTHKREPQICNGAIEEGTVTCPVHFWQFDIVTGDSIKQREDERNSEPDKQKMRVTQSKRTRGLRTYRVIERDGFVWTVLDESTLLHNSQ